jgi:hypothetical protein
VQIPAEKDEQYKAQLQVLAAAIPVLTNDGTKSYPTFSTIMATQTQTRSVAATGERSYSHAIKRSGPPGREPPHGDPFQGFAAAGKAADGGGGGGDGGGDDEGDPDDPNHRRRRYTGSNGKLSGKEPTVFTGDRKDAESFILEWQIYQMLNYDAAVMRQPFTRATLFLSFIKGPAVHEWNMLQVNWLMTRARTGALPSEEFLYDTIEAAFRSAFTDTMSVQRAKAEFHLISMEHGDLDGYVSKFERLARLAGYDLNSSLVLDRFRLQVDTRLVRRYCQRTRRTGHMDRLGACRSEIPTEISAHSGQSRQSTVEGPCQGAEEPQQGTMAAGPVAEAEGP